MKFTLGCLLAWSLVQSCCVSEWVSFQNSLYTVSPIDSYLNLPAATAACSSMSAHLVSIESDAENTFVSTFVSSTYFPFWIDVSWNGAWVYGNGNPLSYHNWQYGTVPTGLIGFTDSAQMWPASAGMWVALPGSASYARFVCEKQMAPKDKGTFKRGTPLPSGHDLPSRTTLVGSRAECAYLCMVELTCVCFIFNPTPGNCDLFALLPRADPSSFMYCNKTL